MQNAYKLVNSLQERVQTYIANESLDVRNFERKAGLKDGAVRNILNKTSKNPGIEAISAIAKLLNCSIDELVGNQTDKTSLTVKEDQRKREKSITVWDPILYENCLKEVQRYIESREFSPKPDMMLFFIREAYIYSLEGKEIKPDLKFIKWIADTHCI